MRKPALTGGSTQAYLTFQIKRLKNKSPGQPFDLISAEGSRTAPYYPLLLSSSLDGRGADWSFSADVLYVSVNLEAAESFSPLSPGNHPWSPLSSSASFLTVSSALFYLRPLKINPADLKSKTLYLKPVPLRLSIPAISAYFLYVGSLSCGKGDEAVLFFFQTQRHDCQLS